MTNSIEINGLLEKNCIYVGWLSHFESKQSLVIFKVDEIDELHEEMNSFPSNDRKVLQFNRFIMAGLFEFKTDQKGYPMLPDFAQYAMKVPVKYKEVLCDDSSDNFIFKAVENSICINKFIPQNKIVSLISKIKYKFFPEEKKWSD